MAETLSFHSVKMFDANVLEFRKHRFSGVKLEGEDSFTKSHFGAVREV